MEIFAIVDQLLDPILRGEGLECAVVYKNPSDCRIRDQILYVVLAHKMEASSLQLSRKQPQAYIFLSGCVQLCSSIQIGWELLIAAGKGRRASSGYVLSP